MKRYIAFLLFIILQIFSSCSAHTPVPCRTVLSAITDGEAALPSGIFHDKRAAQGHDEFLPERLINSLFGGGSRPPMRDGWLDMALFLPTSNMPCEIAVILCDSSDTATDTARLLLLRLDTVRNARANDGEYSEILDKACVTICGNYVIFIISSDTENALKLARSAITKSSLW